MTGKQSRERSDGGIDRPTTDEEVENLVHRATDLLDELRSTFAEIKAVLRVERVE